MELSPIHRNFGVKIAGLALSGAMHSVDLNALREAIEKYSVVHLPNQDMNDEKQLALTRLLGEPEPEHVTFGTTGEVTYFGTVGNVKDDGSVADATNARYQSGNQLWHSDSSFRETPSFVSILHAYEVPDEGGDTEFVSQRAAYAALPDDLKRRIDPLFVIHDYVFSRSPIAPVHPNHAASLPPVMHPLVKTNPAHGERNLYVGSHARSIVGMSGISGRAVLDDLLERTTREEQILRHAWQPGDTIIWDNRCILHRGTGYDASRWRRRLRQTRVIGAEKGLIHQPILNNQGSERP